LRSGIKLRQKKMAWHRLSQRLKSQMPTAKAEFLTVSDIFVSDFSRIEIVEC